MDILAMAVGSVLADRSLSVEAQYIRAGSGAPVSVRIIRRSPDRVARYSSGQFVVDTDRVLVAVADCPDLAPGDVFDLGSVQLEVSAAPERDASRLLWDAQVREL